MKSHVLASLLRPRSLEVLYNLEGTVFRITGFFKEVIFYDALEPEAGTRVVIQSTLDEFDIDLNTIVSIKENQ